jgi:hypothetical protein
MIQQTIDKWHRFLAGALPGGLDELLDDDVVFYSPVVFTPQQGKAVTTMYLTAAGTVFGGPGKPSSGSGGEAGGSSKFRYTKEILSGHHAMLEFEADVGGKYVNGVDIITCNDAGRIVEFRVMVRPLQAVNMLHQQMMAMLERMKS